MYKVLPAQSYLREALDYDPLTGELTWRTRPRHHFRSGMVWKRWNTRFAGKPAGFVDRRPSGTVREISINDRTCYASRVIWKWVTGDDPAALIDHRDTDESNNHWGNLRLATYWQNGQNRGRQRNNVSGFKGVCRDRRQSERWLAHIQHQGKSKFLGSFATAEEAYAAYCAAAHELHREFAAY